VTLLAYRFALNPAPAQERPLRSHAGAARVAFNWGLARVKAVMDQRAAEATYGITSDDLTPAISWSLYSLRKDWDAAKGTVAPWWAECSKEAYNTGLDQLARALKNWGDSRKGQRKGKPAGFPRFRSRRKARASIRFTTGAFRCEDRHAVLPRIGRVKLAPAQGMDIHNWTICAATHEFTEASWRCWRHPGWAGPSRGRGVRRCRWPASAGRIRGSAARRG